MEPGHASVHWSKARKSDCPECRRMVREAVHAAPTAPRIEQPQSALATEEAKPYEPAVSADYQRSAIGIVRDMVRNA
jgi:hypothetical protein